MHRRILKITILFLLNIFHRKKELFMPKVQGESMINAGILDGDYVIVEKQATAENGDMVVTLIDDGATVKNVLPRKEGVIRLQPENDAMEPFILEDVTIFREELLLLCASSANFKR